jgi:hypothetical protein
MDASSPKSSSSYTFRNQGFYDDSYSDVFDPNKCTEKDENTSVPELYMNEMDVLQYNIELFSKNKGQFQKKEKSNAPKRKISPSLKLTLPRKKNGTTENTTF